MKRIDIFKKLNAVYLGYYVILEETQDEDGKISIDVLKQLKSIPMVKAIVKKLKDAGLVTKKWKNFYIVK